MPTSRLVRRRYYAALFSHARKATWEDMGGKSLIIGIVISIVAGLLYLVLTGHQDDPVLGVLAVLISALALFVVVFVIHLAVAPAHLHEDVLDKWEKSAAEVFHDWRETIKETEAGWNKSLADWQKSNEVMDHHIVGLTLTHYLDAAQRWRDRLAASEELKMPDDGQLRASVDAWDGRAAAAARSASESDAEFYLRPAAPMSSGPTWQQELVAFLLIRESRLEEILHRHDSNKPQLPSP
jgi:hypothetical protein